MNFSMQELQEIQKSLTSLGIDYKTLNQSELDSVSTQMKKIDPALGKRVGASTPNKIKSFLQLLEVSALISASQIDPDPRLDEAYEVVGNA